MKFRIPKKRLFKILDDIAHGPAFSKTPYDHPESTGLAFVYRDDKAVEELARLGLVELRIGDRIVKKVADFSLRDCHKEQFTEIYQISEFVTIIGLAILRDLRKKGD